MVTKENTCLFYMHNMFFLILQVWVIHNLSLDIVTMGTLLKRTQIKK